MTREEKQKAIDALKISAPIMAVTQEEFKDYIQTLNKIMDWLEQEPRKGHWTEEFNDLEGEVRFTCSSCGKYQLFGTDFCYYCGSDNREVEE